MQETFDRLWLKSIERDTRVKEQSEQYKKAEFSFRPNADFKL
jgi:hypothetical protein